MGIILKFLNSATWKKNKFLQKIMCLRLMNQSLLYEAEPKNMLITRKY